MALKASGTYRSTYLADAVFEVGTMTLVIAKDGASGTLSFGVRTWLSEASFLNGDEPNTVPEWVANEVAWDPAGAAPLAQATAYVTAKLQAGGFTGIVTV